MPVQKRQCPQENMSYAAEGLGSRYSLFSSTTVLQAGISSSDDVIAVVTATGVVSRVDCGKLSLQFIDML